MSQEVPPTSVTEDDADDDAFFARPVVALCGGKDAADVTGLLTT